MIICVFCIAEMYVDNKPSLKQLKSINTQMQKSIVFSVAFFLRVGTTNMAAAYCYGGIPLRFLASLFDIQIQYLVYI